ncbi:MAG TPA: hypothetical protein PLX89_08620 [Verrucomicrobiota bacterium]|nr:hypothetical protein [Verrucomicrobiales bacterium]HRI13055.1 hypothetical protein [Verrucomicrobiota bacterium]
MKSSVRIALVVVGGLLIAGPLLALQWQVHRAAEFYERHGGGSALPDEIRPRPYAAYDWASLASGAVLVLLGTLEPCLAKPKQTVRDGL